MFARRGPGLVGTAARPAAVVGVAGNVRHRQEQKWAGQQQAEMNEQQAAYDAGAAAAQQAAPPPPQAPAAPDYAVELEQLAQLVNQGILTQDEFEAKKKQILGI